MVEERDCVIQMTWQKTWNKNREKEQPNRLRSKPTIAFRSNLSSVVLSHIKKLISQKKKSEFINKAIEMRYYFITNKERFISDMIKEDFPLTKHLLRKEGSRRNAVTDK